MSKKFFILLIHLLVINVSSINAQTTLSSLEQIKSYTSSGEFEHAKKSIAIYLNNEPESSAKYTQALHLSGELKLQLGQYQEAETDFLKALKLNREENREDLVAENYSSLGIAEWKIGHNEDAKEYLLQAAEIQKKLNAPKKEADIYNNLGLIHSQNDQETALKYYNKSLLIYEKTIGKAHENYLLTLTNIAILKREMGSLIESKDLLIDINNQWINLYGEMHPKVAFTTENLGQTYFLLKNETAALLNFNNALTTYKKIYTTSHPEIASIYLLLSNVCLKQNKFKKALLYLDSATVYNQVKKDSEEASNYLDKQLQIAIFQQKAETYFNKYTSKSIAPINLQQSVNELKKASVLLDDLRHVLINKKDKIALGITGHQIYSSAIKALLILRNEPLNRRKNLNSLFDFIEKSKSSVLLESMQDAQAKKFAGLPSDILEKEQVLTAQISLLENLYIKNQNEEIRNKLLILNADYRNLIQQIEHDYPKYYQLKYSQKAPKLDEIQAQLKKGELMLSYFLQEEYNKIIVLYISKNQVQIKEIQLLENYDKILYAFRNAIRHSNFKIFKQVSYKLSRQLGVNNLSKKYHSIIIIPSDFIGTIPFESLVCTNPKNANSFSELGYLVLSKNVSYQYSTSLWLQNKNKSFDSKESFILSPIFFDDPLSNLPATAIEAKKIDSILVANKYTNNLYLEAAATKSEVEKHNTGAILHLPTHGIVNFTKPELSGLYFSKTVNSNGFLSTGDFYNLTLNFNLITLSACETGLGKISKGEGVIGLTRALLYAGARNIVVSFWQVDDNSTQELMVNFYSNLIEKKESYAASLSSAKKTLIQSENYSSPFYWSAFILIGD